MKKILHWDPRFGNYFGGGQIYISNIIQNMQGFSHYVLSDKLIPKQHIEFYKNIEKNIIYSPPPNILTLKSMAFPINLLSSILRLKQKKNIYKKIKPDLTIIHGLGIYSTLENLNFTFKIDLISENYFQYITPKILTVHNLFSPFYKKIEFINYENKIFEQFETFICIDNHIYTFLKKKYPSKEIHLVPNSIPDNFFNNSYKKNQYNPNKPILGFVGRYGSSKGITILEEMLEKAPDNFNFLLIFSTEEPLKHEIIEKFKSHDNAKIFFNIPNNELPKYYKKMDLLFNPVIDKGISRVTLEAMANGVVPIMIDLGDRDPVKNFETGILFNNEKMDDLIENLMSLAMKDYVGMQKKGKLVIKKRFSNSSLIPKLRKIYMDHLN